MKSAVPQPGFHRKYIFFITAVRRIMNLINFLTVRIVKFRGSCEVLGFQELADLNPQTKSTSAHPYLKSSDTQYNNI